MGAAAALVDEDLDDNGLIDRADMRLLVTADNRNPPGKHRSWIVAIKARSGEQGLLFFGCWSAPDEKGERNY